MFPHGHLRGARRLADPPLPSIIRICVSRAKCESAGPSAGCKAGGGGGARGSGGAVASGVMAPTTTGAPPPPLWLDDCVERVFVRSVEQSSGERSPNISRPEVTDPAPDELPPLGGACNSKHTLNTIDNLKKKKIN